MPDKNHDKDHDKNHDKDKDKDKAKPFDNPSQDPNHPSNRTLSPERPPAQRSPAEGFGIPAAELMTAQEADQAGEVPGVGPASPAELSPGPVETIQDQGIGPRTPYPSGNPPPPTETISRSQGIKGAAEKTSVKPGEVSGPAGTAHREPAR